MSYAQFFRGFKSKSLPDSIHKRQEKSSTDSSAMNDLMHQFDVLSTDVRNFLSTLENTVPNLCKSAVDPEKKDNYLKIEDKISAVRKAVEKLQSYNVDESLHKAEMGR
jgi:hypothetical protein